jgi:hypothetical protein
MYLEEKNASKLELLITSVSKLLAPRKNDVLCRTAAKKYCKHSKCSGAFVVNSLPQPMDANMMSHRAEILKQEVGSFFSRHYGGSLTLTERIHFLNLW